MAEDEIATLRQPWSDKENDLIVADYLDMLRLELDGIPFVKKQRRTQLAELISRSPQAIEFKYMNISAALEALGFPRISGYAPMRNLQRSLVDAIERNFSRIVDVTSALDRTEPSGFSDEALLASVAAPILNRVPNQTSDGDITRLVRKFDPAERDLRNRTLGRKGEELVFLNEKMKLFAVDPKLADRVKWVSEEQGDGAGYDILSFEEDGRERLIEVKTTIGCETTPFYLSRNELAVSQERKDAFRLVRLFDFSRSPKAFELSAPLTSFVRLEPNSYTASFT